jgi:FixJ family two-component response regulator
MIRRLVLHCPASKRFMLTANTDDELARATFRRGAFDYISKPFNINHLVRVVETALAS